LDEERTILLRDPVARGFPSGQVLAVIKGDEFVFVFVMFAHGKGNEDGSQNK
jgi:hypothetical protein